MWKGNVKMYFNEIGCEDLNSIGLVQVKDNWRSFVNMAKNIQVTQNVDDLLTYCGTVTFSRRAFFNAIS